MKLWLYLRRFWNACIGTDCSHHHLGYRPWRCHSCTASPYPSVWTETTAEWRKPPQTTHIPQRGRQTLSSVGTSSPLSSWLPNSPKSHTSTYIRSSLFSDPMAVNSFSSRVYTDLKAFKDVGTRTKVFFIRRNLNLLLFKHIQWTNRP